MVENGLREIARRLVLVAAVLAVGLLALGQAEAQPAPRVDGDINTIVFDAVSGRAAEGMNIELFEVKGEAFYLLSAATADANGRADLVAGRPLALGHYELRFQLADYYRKQGVRIGDPAYLDYVPVRFSVDTPNGHYHVPLICTPSSYSTYRGS